MSENILEKIIKNKIEKIDILKKSISLDSLKNRINENKSFVNFKEKIENNIKNDKISEITIDPKELNINADKFDNLLGDDAKFNAAKMIDIFKGEDNDFSKAVCLNAAAGLIVARKYSTFHNAYEDARKHILTGKAFQHLKKIQNA